MGLFMTYSFDKHSQIKSTEKKNPYILNLGARSFLNDLQMGKHQKRSVTINQIAKMDFLCISLGRAVNSLCIHIPTHAQTMGKWGAYLTLSQVIEIHGGLKL